MTPEVKHFTVQVTDPTPITIPFTSTQVLYTASQANLGAGNGDGLFYNIGQGTASGQRVGNKIFVIKITSYL